MKKHKIIYYVFTGLFSAMILMAVGMYLFDTAEVQKTFVRLGYPAYLVYPLAIVKIFGIAVLWLPTKGFLKEWVYAGFLFDFILAFFAHYMVSDGEQIGAVIALVLLIGSYFFFKKIRK